MNSKFLQILILFCGLLTVPTVGRATETPALWRAGRTCSDEFRKSVLWVPKQDWSPRRLAYFARYLATDHAAEIYGALSRTKPVNGRVYVKMYEDTQMTVWAIKWEQNGTGIHDHMLSDAGIYVMKGYIIENRFQPPASAPIETNRYAKGDILEVPKGTVHSVSGDGVTLHIYLPKLDVMTNYQVNPSGLLVPVGQEQDNAP